MDETSACALTPKSRELLEYILVQWKSCAFLYYKKMSSFNINVSDSLFFFYHKTRNLSNIQYLSTCMDALQMFVVFFHALYDEFKPDFANYVAVMANSHLIENS